MISFYKLFGNHDRVTKNIRLPSFNAFTLFEVPVNIFNSCHSANLVLCQAFLPIKLY